MKARWFASAGLLFVMPSACTPSGSSPAPAPSATAPAPAASGASGAVPELVPGVSIGPVRIGMQRAELDALGLPTKPGPLSSDVTAGPYVTSFDGDRVASIFVELRALPGGARVGGTVFDQTAKITAIAAKLQGCGAVQHNTGADVIVCEGGRALVIAGGPPGIVSLEVTSAERAAKVAGQSPSPSASSAAPAAAARGPVACSAAGLAAANDACLSRACGEISADMTSCKSDSDCVVSSFATCECAWPGPHFSVNAKSQKAARDKLGKKYAAECSCACPKLVPACVAGTCGFKS